MNVNEFEFANAELDRFLGAARPYPVALEVSSGMSPFSFGVRFENGAVRLIGADEACVLHAVYTLLEQLGFRFEITGPIRPAAPAWDRVSSVTIQPQVRRRGIRQHINFPMDVSSYPLAEALEYIRELARLRFNYILFHSYPNQWVDGPQAGANTNAGHFFYGQRHDIPDVPLLKQHIRNTKTFCIPEIESVYDDEPERGRQAVAWLRAVMAECKRCGMRVQFSFEPRSQKVDVEATLVTARRILELYPDIDALELVTQEAGGWSEKDDPTLFEDLTHMYGEAVNHPSVKPVLEKGNHLLLGMVFREMGHNIMAIKALRGELPVSLALGVYCPIAKFHGAVYALADACLPRDVDFMFLPGHSSARVASHVRQSPFPDSLLARTTICSWLEFDGIMYLQQNAVPGIADLLRETKLPDGTLAAVVFNHWRTAENRMTARYASDACIAGVVEPDAFYRKYAEALGVGELDTHVRAMKTLADADNLATNGLGNIGFCYVGCWGSSGLGCFGNWQPTRILECRELYQSVRDEIRKCAAATEAAAGQSYLRFLDNRLGCSIAYLDAMAAGSELQTFREVKPEQMTPAQRTEAADMCNRALALLDRYMQEHAAQMVDRGCEGTLISLYHTPPAVLKRLRMEYGGITADVPVSSEGIDQPPLPIQFETATCANS